MLTYTKGLAFKVIPISTLETFAERGWQTKSSSWLERNWLMYCYYGTMNLLEGVCAWLDVCTVA